MWFESVKENFSVICCNTEGTIRPCPRGFVRPAKLPRTEIFKFLLIVNEDDVRHLAISHDHLAWPNIHPIVMKTTGCLPLRQQIIRHGACSANYFYPEYFSGLATSTFLTILRVIHEFCAQIEAQLIWLRLSMLYFHVIYKCPTYCFVTFVCATTSGYHVTKYHCGQKNSNSTALAFIKVS